MRTASYSAFGGPVSKQQILRLLASCAACACLFPVSAHAQLLSHIEQCLPFPTYAEETRNMLGAQESARQVYVVAWVDLHGGTTLPASVRQKIVQELLHREFDPESTWLPEAKEIGVRGALEQNGYFEAIVHEIEVRILSSQPGRTHVAVVLEVEEGPQYRLTEIRFAARDRREPLEFPFAALRKLIPISDGEILDVGKVLRGLDEMRLFFGERGYIDFVSTPSFDTHPDQSSITLTIEIDTGQQFHISGVEFKGMDPNIVRQLKGVPVPGDLFDNSAYQTFFRENKQLIPCARPEDVDITRSFRDGTVHLQFEIPSCADLWTRLLRCLQMRFLGVRDFACPVIPRPKEEAVFTSR